MGQTSWMTTPEFMEMLQQHPQATGEEGFIQNLLKANVKTVTLYKIIVDALQTYAVNCAMTTELHPQATCYVPGSGHEHAPDDASAASAEDHLHDDASTEDNLDLDLDLDLDADLDTGQ